MTPPAGVLATVREVERDLAEAGVPDPRADAELLVAHVAGTARSALYGRRHPLAPGEHARLAELVARRRRREPLQYVLGEWGFRGLTLAVDPRALVPRSETEVVVERCLSFLRTLERPVAVDVGVGSGAIALALADEHPGVRVVGVDVSADALALARENAERTRLAARVELVHGHLFAGLEGPFDLVVSNPPYVTPAELERLEPEVRDWEPRPALLDDGTTEAIVRDAPSVLRPGGRLVLEAAGGRAGPLGALLREVGYRDVAVTPDLAGIGRVVEGVAPAVPRNVFRQRG